MAKKTTTRRAAAPIKSGHPAPGERKIVPSDYDKMGQLYGSGYTFREIAKLYRVHPNTITHHFNSHIFPMIRASSTRSLEAELIKITQLERVAWQCFSSNKPSELREQVKSELARFKNDPRYKDKEITRLLEKTLVTVHRRRQKAWLDIVQWCIETRCKLEGHFAAVKVRVQHEEYRVAGRSPADGQASMFERARARIIERREYEERLKESGVVIGRMLNPHDN